MLPPNCGTATPYILRNTVGLDISKLTFDATMVGKTEHSA
ncbi:TPA: IS110 family transposase, partial [Neisseria gonorrhoeae]